MNNTPENTTNSIEILQQRCIRLEQEKADWTQEKAKLAQEMADLAARLKWLEEHFLVNQRKKFGSSSEKTNPDQLMLFDEAEATAQPLVAEPTIEKIIYERRKKQPGHREEQLKDLPVEVIEYRLPEDEQACSCCGQEMHEMSTEVRQELKIIPAQLKVVKHVRYVYSCRRCEQEELQTPIRTAPMPEPVYKGSFVSPSLMAYIMNQKYVDGLPLYRQEQQFGRLGIAISRQNMSRWVLQGGNRWLTPLYERLHSHLREKDVLHADETTVQVLHEPGRAAETKSYMWLYRTGQDDQPIVLYDYRQTRASEHPRDFLAGFKGYLQVDGYAGYNKVENVTLIGCWSHARRKYDEALAALPASKRSAGVAAKEGLEFCNRLFAIERDLKNATAEERYKARLLRSRPVLNAFLAWLNAQAPKVLPKSALGQAITYCLNQWDKLEAYLQDGRLEIDNNRAERSIKPFVIGRKGWLFMNTSHGAKASAVIYSIVETAKENGLNPFAYLTYLFERLPNIDIKDPNALDELLPYSASLPSSCRVSK